MSCLLAWIAVVAAGHAAVDEVANTFDTLVYKDGDRVHGKLLERTDEMIVFRSTRFGELRVKAADAVVIPREQDPDPAPAVKPIAAAAAEKTAPKKDAPGATKAKKAPAGKPPAGTIAAAKPAAAKDAAEVRARAAATEAEAERVSVWDRFTPGVMTARVRTFFGPWKGRFAFSTEVVSDAAHRNNHSFEARLRRKWERDELQLSSRYDYAETNNLPSTDMLKASGSWRREFSKAHFAHYRPSVEWNRASKRKGVPNDYILLQQELGVGFNLLNTPARKVRTGVSGNLFNIWNSAPGIESTSRTTPSAFEELEFKLPWQMGLTQRGVWYPVNARRDGWENRVELNKKLTETLSTSLRHEIRRHNPDGSAQDFERLKLLFAMDF